MRNDEITVVVQGGVHPDYTPRCLASLRRSLPGATLILSTWKGSDCAGLDCDELIQSDDPGAEFCDIQNRVLNNFDRQLVSTRAGLECARTPYALKFRSDMLLLDAGFLRWFGRFDTPSAPPEYFRNRLLVLDYYTRNPRILPVPFHPSDWLAFGNTDDLRRYYDIPLQPSPERRWFAQNRKTSRCFPGLLMRYAAEQYFCLGFLRGKEPVRCDSYYDASPENIEQTERFFARNMVVLDYGSQLAARFLKRHPNYLGDRANILRHRDWTRLYRHHCLGGSEAAWMAYRAKCSLQKRVFYDLRRETLSFLDDLGLKQGLKVCCEKLGRR